MLLLLSAAFAAGCADDKEEGGNDIKLNPDPTQLSNITLMKATFAADEFNMISEPGFELFPDEAIDYRSLWVFKLQSDLTAVCLRVFRHQRRLLVRSFEIPE